MKWYNVLKGEIQNERSSYMDIRKITAAGCCFLISLTSCGRTIERAPRQPVAVTTSTTAATTAPTTSKAVSTAYIVSNATTQSTSAATVQTAAKATAATAAQTAAPPKTTAAPVSTTTTTVTTTTTTKAPVKFVKEELPQCKSAALYCRNDDTYLYTDSLNMCIAPASLTKLVTAAVALKYTNPDDVYTVGSELDFVAPDASRADLAKGNKLTMYDLITGMLMVSGNDAAYTIAVSTARTLNPDIYMSDSEAINYFVDIMNAFAVNIGMYSTNFENPDGWDNADQYTTASDLINLADYVLNDAQLSELVSTHYKYVTFQTGQYTEWINSNLLIDAQSSYYSPECIGIKTGTTDDAGNCLLSAFSKNGKTYISAVTGCLSDSDRYSLMLKLYNSLT